MTTIDIFDECEKMMQRFTLKTPLSRSSSGESGESTEEAPEDCRHMFQDTVCTLCGEERNGTIDYSKTFDTKGGNGKVQKSSLNPKNHHLAVREDLRDLNLDEDIQAEICRMYEIVTKGQTKRSKSRKSILMACLTNIYIKREIPQDEAPLLQYFKLKKKDHSTGNKHVKLALADYRYLYEGPEQHFAMLFRKINIDPRLHKDILDIYHRVLNLEPATNEYGPVFKNLNPKIIAAIVIFKWHLQTSLNPLEITDFAKICCIPYHPLFTAFRECDPQISAVIDKNESG